MNASDRVFYMPHARCASEPHLAHRQQRSVDIFFQISVLAAGWGWGAPKFSVIRAKFSIKPQHCHSDCHIAQEKMGNRRR